MSQQAHSSGKTVTRSYRTGVGGGFWSGFLWSIVGFVVGSLVAIAVAGRLVPARSADEAFADLGRSGGWEGAR